MTQEEFNELSQRFFQANQIKAEIFRCQEKLDALEKAGPHTFDVLYSQLKNFIPDEYVDKWIKDIKVNCEMALREQIKIYEQKFEEL